MSQIDALTNVDILQWLIWAFVIMYGFVAIVTVIGKTSEIIGKPVKWVKKKNEDHELLVVTAKNLQLLETRHNEDDEKIKKTLDTFMEEIRNSVLETGKHVNTYAENRVHDREQSFAIQKELSTSISEIVKSATMRDDQIDVLKLANKELLADRINQKYKHYININGIPSDEVDEFNNLFYAYKALGGNHSGDAKYKYVTEHLEVIPTKTELIYD